MIERVVYLLGAGFSAPLGLPVTANFLLLAKDMFFSNPTKHKHFEPILEEIARIASVKNYYEADLFNIEEVLSILEMRAQLAGEDELRDRFADFISDVIRHHTPTLQPEDPLPGNWQSFVMGSPGQPYHRFCLFAANLLGLKFTETGNRNTPTQDRFTVTRDLDPRVRYAVVTLNYDRVLEQVGEFVRHQYTSSASADTEFVVRMEPVATKVLWEVPLLVKLHGDLEAGTIVPPTWSKGVYPEIAPAWQIAHALLREATQVRVIGYSLPEADAYVKYLLKAAVSEASHLKALDVLCLDPDGSVERRYRSFVTFRYMRFTNGSTESYLDRVRDLQQETNPLRYNVLERAHAQFF